jgi:RNA-directed DNA polymerase
VKKTPLGSVSEHLMEQIVDVRNMEQAWKNVKANGGAPGPDGVTLDEFAQSFRDQWPRVRQQLLEGTYEPSAARRKSIPKPDGSQRDLGIPNVQERLIQQAILQVLTPIFDPGFSESSFGFRPNRSAHGAARQVQAHIRAGYRHCVDMDLSKFFDRVQHDVLLARVARKVRDKRLLRLIGRYLRAGVMVGARLQPSLEGTMQGGPLSPLLANILLDDFDKELERRGLHFVRYADDFLVFTKTREAARRVYVSVGRYLTRKLKLVVNRQKSRVCSTDGVEFLGFVFKGYGGQIRVRCEESPQVQGPGKSHHASQPRRVDVPPVSRTSPVFPGLGGLLRPGANQELLQRTGQVGPTSHPVLLLETVASPADQDRQLEEARHSGARSGYTWCQQQRPLGDVRQSGSA